MPTMLKPDLTEEIFAGHFLPALNARLRVDSSLPPNMTLEILRYVGALLLVLALIGAADRGAQMGRAWRTKSVEQKRLAVVET